MKGTTQDTLASIGLLVLRLGAGGFLIYGHGWGKLVHFSERALRFPDPLHIGSPASLALTVFAEVACALAVVLGVGTRLAALVLVILFAVIAFGHHGGDPFGDRELALLYLVPFLTLVFTGGGRFGIDLWLGRGGRGGGNS